MSVLSDRTIKALITEGRLRIEPFAAANVQPSSVDLRLGRHFRVFEHSRYTHIDVRAPQPGLTQGMAVADDEPFVLHPGEFALGTTLERVGLPDDLVGRLEGKSSLGRLGLIIHSTRATSIPALPARSPWNSRMSPSFRSRCIRACSSARCRFSR